MLSSKNNLRQQQSQLVDGRHKDYAYEELYNNSCETDIEQGQSERIWLIWHDFCSARMAEGKIRSIAPYVTLK
jgi:hypothetical protein